MPKKNSTYWKQRFDQVEQSANDKSVRYVRQLEKKYQTAASEIDKQINAWYQRIANNNEVTITEARKLLSASELKEFKWTVKDYIEFGQANAIDQQWMKELENASAKFHINRLEALKLECRQQIEVATTNGQQNMFDTLGDVYKDTFYHSCYEIQKGVGVGFDVSKLDDGQVSKLLNKPWSVDGENFSSKVWKNKRKLINTLDQELSRMVLTGEAPKKAIQNIKKAMDTSLYAAKRLVLTEQAYFTSLAQKDSFTELDVEEYEIVATLDNRTSEVCQEQDGKHYPVKDMSPGVNAPPFHVFCRSTTCPYFNDEFTINDKRVAKGDDGSWYEVPTNMKYPEWKDTFVDGGSKDNLTLVVDDIEDLEKQFSNLTEGYSYDDFMKDFGSIEEGFDGASDEEIKKAKDLANKIESLREKSGYVIKTKQEPIQAFRLMGINLKDNSTGGVSDETLNKFVDFVADFENNHRSYFNMNKVELKSISIIDSLEVRGKTAGGGYYSDSKSIRLMKKAIETKPTSKLITYSKSDDHELHFFAHEYGHYVADTLITNLSVTDYDFIQKCMIKYFDGDMWSAKTSNLVDVLGSYGSKNAQEAFAEAFAEAYTCEKPGKFAKIFKEELEAILKKSTDR